MKKQGILQIWSFILISITILSACSKSNDGTNTELEDGSSTLIEDLAGDTQASVGSTDGKEKRDFYTFIFNFATKKQTWLKNATDSAKLKNTDWDLAFSGFYNSTLYINNGTFTDNPAYGNSSKTKMVLLKQDYDNVTTAPSDSEFDKSTISAVGYAVDENSNGWYDYNIANHLVTIVPNRTYVLRLSDGKYAKLEMLNIYKGNPAAVTDLNWPAPYFTFRYYVQEDGTTNLKTK